MASAELQAISKQRWQGDEPDDRLTWFAPMTGDSLWTIYRKHREFTHSVRILEIGVGYGRLLRTALKQAIPFGSFTGLELSGARVQRLGDELASERIRFEEGDVEAWQASALVDVVLCSSTFEHLFPDCRKALANLRAQLAPGGMAFIDFLGNVPRRVLGLDPSPIVWALAALGMRVRYFAPFNTYIRFYNRRELRALFAQAGFKVHAIEACIIGDSPMGPIKRLVVVAAAA